MTRQVRGELQFLEGERTWQTSPRERTRPLAIHKKKVRQQDAQIILAA
jgi:hypothetical protein